MAKKKNKVAVKGADSVVTRQRPVYTEILVRPIHRGVNDIGSWRSALRLADLGNRTKLYDLFTDLLIDGYLSDAIDKRIDAVTDADLAFTIDGKRIDEMDALMDTPEFESLRSLSPNFSPWAKEMQLAVSSRSKTGAGRSPSGKRMNTGFHTRETT